LWAWVDWWQLPPDLVREGYELGVGGRLGFELGAGEGLGFVSFANLMPLVGVTPGVVVLPPGVVVVVVVLPPVFPPGVSVIVSSKMSV